MRRFVNGKFYVANAQGNDLIYGMTLGNLPLDVAYTDLELIEKDMLTQATKYINQIAGMKDLEYIEDIRVRVTNRRGKSV